MDEKQRIIAGISGGPDSMALADMLRQKRAVAQRSGELTETEQERSELIFCHVNYHHRPTADRDEQIVRTYAMTHQIELHILHADPDLAQGNFQAWAREVRYSFFEQIADEKKASVLALAHQQDDLIETWLMQKNRKIIPDFFGLPEYSFRQNLTVWRPLLGFTKEELKNWCSAHQIPYGIDESNLTDEYLRNRIRHQTIEKMNAEQRSEILDEIEHQNRILKEKREAALALSENSRFLEEQDTEIRNLALSELLYQKTKIRFSARALSEAFRQLQESSRFEFVLPAEPGGRFSQFRSEKRAVPSEERSDQTLSASAKPLIHVYDLMPFCPDSALPVRMRKKGQTLRTDQSAHRFLLIGALRPACGYSEEESSEHPRRKTLYLKITEENCGAAKAGPENRSKAQAGRDYRKTETGHPFLIIENPEELRRLCKSRQSMKISEDWGVKWTDHPQRIESFSVSSSDFPLRLDHVQTGDAIELRYGKKKISRILIDQKIERSARQTFPLLRNNHGKVIFMPLTGCDVSHFEENSSSGVVLFSLTNSEQNQTDSFEK